MDTTKKKNFAILIKLLTKSKLNTKNIVDQTFIHYHMILKKKLREAITTITIPIYQLIKQNFFFFINNIDQFIFILLFVKQNFFFLLLKFNEYICTFFDGV